MGSNMMVGSEGMPGGDDSEECDCKSCNGGGKYSRAECVVDGILYPAIVNADCAHCDGTGFTDCRDDEEPEPNMSEFV